MKSTIAVVWALAVVGASLFSVSHASEAKASAFPVNKVHLRAAPKMQTWQSKQSLPANRELGFVIYVNGKNISNRGRLVSNCRWMLITRTLTIDLKSCGTAPLTVRYAGRTNFTLGWWLNRFS